MDVGISLASSHPGTPDDLAARHMLERARAAIDAGVTSITVGDHHGTGPTPYVQNVPFVGRLLAEWNGPVGCLFLLPAWSPVLLAEQVGTLATMTDATFIVQTGLGRPDEPGKLGLDVGHRGRRLERVLVAAQTLLAGGSVTDDDLGLRDVSIAPRPSRPVEWWVGGGSDDALDRAARLGSCWYANADLGPSRAQELLTTYRAACDRHGRDPVRLPIRKDVIVSADGTTARALGDQLIAQGYRGGMARDAVAYGSPTEVAEQLGVFAEIGFTDVIVRVMSGVPQEIAVSTCGLLGEVAAAL